MLAILAIIATIYGIVSVVLALLLGRFFRRNKRRAKVALRGRHEEQRRKAS